MINDRKQLIKLADPKTNKGWVRAVARLMSLAERSPEDAVALVTELSGSSKPRIILGITGAPGSGKSILVSRLIAVFRAMHPDKRVGVIAVDPSSPFSGGAILGDQIRMMEHSGNEMVFIRSVATRGQTGGITFGTLGTLCVMGHIGCDIVLIETVGVGQSEVGVREVADIVAVVLAPGQGDTVQFLKAGLMEIGDCFVVNKSDRPDAPGYRALLADALVLLGKSSGVDRTNDIFSTSARDNTGITALAEYMEKRYAENSGDWDIYRTENMHAIIRRLIIEKCKERAKEKLAMMMDPVGRILSGAETVESISEELFSLLVH